MYAYPLQGVVDRSELSHVLGGASSPHTVWVMRLRGDGAQYSTKESSERTTCTPHPTKSVDEEAEQSVKMQSARTRTGSVLFVPRTILGRLAQFTKLFNGFAAETGPPLLWHGGASTSLQTVSTASASSGTTPSNLAATRPSFSESGASSPQSAGITTWPSPGSKPIRASPHPRRWVTPLQTASPPEAEQAPPVRRCTPLRPPLALSGDALLVASRTLVDVPYPREFCAPPILPFTSPSQIGINCYV